MRYNADRPSPGLKGFPYTTLYILEIGLGTTAVYHMIVCETKGLGVKAETNEAVQMVKGRAEQEDIMQHSLATIL